MVSWNRLLAGRFRDSLVGRDILIGTLATVAAVIVVQAGHLVPGWLGWKPERPMDFFETSAFTNPIGVIALLLDFLVFPMLYFFMLLVLVVVLRREWLGVTTWLLIWTVANLSWLKAEAYIEHPEFLLLVLLASFVIRTVILLRFGFLSYAAGEPSILLFFAPLTLDFSAWYFGTGITYALVVGAIALYAFFISLGNRPLISAAWLAED
jgi:serine/threonine-protein kinase